MAFSISRSIDIDAGHRVPTHGSKCANLHGHRYKVFAECVGASLGTEGEQSDMVLDFGFLKQVMTDTIDFYCDHGMILWYKDPYFLALAGPNVNIFIVKQDIEEKRIPFWFDAGDRGDPTKLLIVPFIPTAERLAEFWYKEMYCGVRIKSNNLAELKRVSVWETPQCMACYPA